MWFLRALLTFLQFSVSYGIGFISSICACILYLCIISIGYLISRFCNCNQYIFNYSVLLHMYYAAFQKSLSSHLICDIVIHVSFTKVCNIFLVILLRDTVVESQLKTIRNGNSMLSSWVTVAFISLDECKTLPKADQLLSYGELPVTTLTIILVYDVFPFFVLCNYLCKQWGKPYLRPKATHIYMWSDFTNCK